MSERPRIRVAVLGGGRSSEHEVSLRSAASVVAALDPERFDVVPVQIDRGGAWQIEISSARLSLEPGAESRSLVPSAPAGLPAPAGIGPIDVVLPILHGPFGEDGRLQGLLDMINIPYVGSGVAASALTMDKDKVKYVLRGVGIAVADHVVLRNRRFGAADAEAVRAPRVSLLREAGQPRLQRRHQQGAPRRTAWPPPSSWRSGTTARCWSRR